MIRYLMAYTTGMCGIGYLAPDGESIVFDHLEAMKFSTLTKLLDYAKEKEIERSDFKIAETHFEVKVVKMM